MESKSKSKSLPAYHIAEAIETRIRSGLYRQGHWLPTERILAEEFNVSRSTLRQAIVALEERNLVQRAAGCRPLIRMDSPAGIGSEEKRPDVRVERRSIGLWITGDPTDRGGAMTMRGVQRALNSDTFRLVVGNPLSPDQERCIQDEARSLTGLARDTDIAGIILWYLGGAVNLPVLESLRAAKIPLVFLDRLPPEGFDGDFVGIDNKHASAEITEHLISHGHTRIAYVSTLEQASTVVERMAGYRSALAHAGIHFDRKLVFNFAEPDAAETQKRKSVDEILDRVLAMPERPTAIMAVNDHTAFQILRGLQARGVHISQEIAVAGFDDVERWTLGHPVLTTVSQPFERMGMTAVRLLLRRLELGEKSPFRHVLLDACVTVRESTHL